MDAKISYFITSEGLKIFYQYWVPDAPKAVLILVHGMGDHSGRYGPFVRYFVERGFAVALYDQRGHGRSDGERGHADQFQDYLQDLAQFIQMTKERFPKSPVFLVGHSFGGQIALNFVVRYAKGLRGVVLCSPNIVLKLPVPTWKKRMADWAQNSMGHMRLTHPLNAKMLSHDPDVVAAYENDPLIFNHVTARLGALIMQNLEIIMAMALRVHLPTLFIQAGDDVICSPEGTKAFFQRIPIVKKQLKIYDGMFHELLNETCRDQVFSDVEAWLNEQLKEDSQWLRPYSARAAAASAGAGGI
jgi:alpha-beta hydrolase superfamily lysophospholipase